MRSEPNADLSADSQSEPDSLCPDCTAEFGGLSFTENDVPDRQLWQRVHARYHDLRGESESLGRSLADATLGLASFENLFRISPFPIMEQDYTHVEAWMDELRDQGVTSIRDYLGDDIEKIRSVVPLIWIVSANPAAVRAVGLPHEELIGPIDPRIVNDGSLPSWLSQFESVWNREPEAHAAFTAGTPDGREYDAESTLAAPIVEGEPDFSRAVFTLIDVTEHRSEERRMEELIDSKNRFLASVSHEIRTPLTAILGFGQVLQDDVTLADDEREFMVTSILQQAREMSDLVEDLLIAARAEAGQVNVEARRIDTVEQIDRTLAAGGSFTTGVRVESRSESVMAMADPARVRQILRNLLTNAERYGGPDVSVSVAFDESWVYVDVSDDGPGLPRDQWEPIFQPYHRAHDPEGRPGSVGIGLTISRQLAELMGGSLHYFYTGERSVFRLALPADPPE